jgi:lipid-A-disaccharide synthase
VIYKTSFVSWLIAKLFLSVPFICIVNLLANKKIIPELIQRKSNPQNISQQLLSIMNNPENMKNDLLKIKRMLGDGTSYKKTATYIVNYD